MSLLWGLFAKQTYNFEEPINWSHPISGSTCSIIKREWVPLIYIWYYMCPLFISDTKEPCHIYKHSFRYEYVVSHMNESCHIRITHSIHASICDVPHVRHKQKIIVSLMNASYSYLTPTVPRTGWRRLTGSFKLQIIFHKRATKHGSLLRKMTYKDEGSYESLPPCIHIRHMSNVTYEWVISHINKCFLTLSLPRIHIWH